MEEKCQRERSREYVLKSALTEISTMNLTPTDSYAATTQKQRKRKPSRGERGGKRQEPKDSPERRKTRYIKKKLNKRTEELQKKKNRKRLKRKETNLIREKKPTSKEGADVLFDRDITNKERRKKKRDTATPNEFEGGVCTKEEVDFGTDSESYWKGGGGVGWYVDKRTGVGGGGGANCRLQKKAKGKSRVKSEGRRRSVGEVGSVVEGT